MSASKDCILHSWRAAMVDRGVDSLPTEQELSAICDRGTIPEPPSPAVARWGHVIAFLQSQSRFGVTWEGLHLTPDLLTPRPMAATPRTDSGPTATPRAAAVPTASAHTPAPQASAMERLRAWRGQAESSGRIAAGTVTDHQLMLLVRPLSTAEDVGQRVPVLAAHAPELYALLNGAGRGGAASSHPSAADDLGKTRPRSALSSTVPPVQPTMTAQPTTAEANARPISHPAAASSAATATATAAPTTLPATNHSPAAPHPAEPPVPWVPGHAPIYPSGGGVRRATAPIGHPVSPQVTPATILPVAPVPAPPDGVPTVSNAPTVDDAVAPDAPPAPSPVSPAPGPMPQPEPAQVAQSASAALAQPAPTDPADATGDLVGGYAEAMSVADQPATTIVEQVVEEGQVTYRWPALPGIVTIFRVVVSDAQRPLVPEMGDVLVATTSTSAQDPAPVNSLFRFVQIWANTGSTVAEAKAAQPRLHAECVRVGSVTEASGAADFGQVSLVWAAPAGAQRVRVYRFPDGVNLTLGHAAFEISADRANLTGCLDRGGEAGATYTYRMIVEARDSSGAGHTSNPVDVRLEWPAVIRAITDLVIHPVRYPTRYEPGEVDLEWTDPPVGKTQVFRIEQPVGAGILGVEVDKGALPQMGFTDTERCRNPIELPDAAGKVRMLGVVWPPNWARIHFVPVTVLGQKALPGTPATDECIVSPGDPRLVDRVTEQVVTFVWPPGATYVRAHLGPLGAAAKDICNGPWHTQVSEEDYRRHGGLRLQLVPPQDMGIFLTASRGQTVSEAVTVPLTRRLRIQYAVEVRRRMRVGPIEYARVAVWAPNDTVQGPPPFVVVFRDDRLPMHARDGTIVATVPEETAAGATPSQAFRPTTLTYSPDMPKWRILVPAGAARGYLRLFVSPSVPPESARRIVVLDPTVDQLRWG